MAEQNVEAWLRGVLPGIHPVIEHLVRASEQIREEIAGALEPLSVRELWAAPGGMTSAGFHARHLAGSTRRLCTYLGGRELSAAQVAEIAAEGTGTEAAGELIALVNEAFDRYDALVRSLAPEDFGALRYVGRKRLETSAISLAIHIAEHGQRHVGQAVSAAKLARSGALELPAPRSPRR